MADGRTGDRANLNPDDTNPLDTGQPIADMRLDLPDAAALQELAQETMVRMLGGLVGLNSGCLTIPSFTWAAPVVQIGSCLFHDAQDAGSNAVDGRVLRHVRGGAYQGSSDLDLSLYGGATLGTIWARRTEIAADQDIRKKWNTTAGAERSFAPNTRRRERVQFATSAINIAGYANPPASAAGTEPWFPIARITAWPAGVPTVQPIRVWDGMLNNGTQVGQVPTNVDALADTNLGLGWLLHQIRRMIAVAADTTLGTNWLTAGATKGIKQLDADLVAGASHPAGIVPYIHAMGKVQWDGTVNPNAYDSVGLPLQGVASINRIGVGAVEFTLVASAFVADTPGVMVTPYYGPNDPLVPMVANVTVLTAGPPWAFRVEVFRLDTAAAADNSFMILVGLEKT